MAGVQDLPNSVAGLLAGLIIIMSLSLLLRVGEFVFGLLKKKSEFSERQMMELSMSLRQSADAIKDLEVHISVLRQELDKLKALGGHMEKCFQAVKMLAGDQWPAIAKKIKEGDFL